ncbi:hypothetical protein PVT67_08190 [Gallaecimonas kandeliae]|uniref:hypothetical protein n=1 Tax=Gallaecimonas kandeliae TaxID=3029055 RepID=UPI0026486540|nr:hypothetical protein [Gallaecimonas kandeliae]WKE67202.1 hypothetical protein PVT67_08190 [Gallaecimonas kandeliae]
MKKAAPLICLALISSGLHCQPQVEITLSRFNKEKLQLLVVNNNDEPASFDYNFCQSSVGDLSFDVIGSDGHRYPFQVMLNEDCDLDSHFRLEPFCVVGKLVPIKDLLSFHGNPKGKLDLNAHFCERGKSGSRVNCLSSNSLEILAE